MVEGATTKQRDIRMYFLYMLEIKKYKLSFLKHLESHDSQVIIMRITKTIHWFTSFCFFYVGGIAIGILQGVR